MRRSTWTGRVVGVSFIDGYPENLLRIWRRMNRDPDYEPEVLVEREPDNKHDPNTIVVRTLTEELGHLPAKTARWLAPLLDGGQVWGGWVEAIVVPDDDHTMPGCEIYLLGGHLSECARQEFGPQARCTCLEAYPEPG